MTVIELKAAIYDLLAQQQFINQKIQELNGQLVEAVKKEKEEKKD